MNLATAGLRAGEVQTGTLILPFLLEECTGLQKEVLPLDKGRTLAAIERLTELDATNERRSHFN
jgi:hypothetical protein